MTYTDHHIIENFSSLLEGLSTANKVILLENLTKSLENGKKNNESDFFDSFGAWGSEKTAEEIVAEIKESRKFKAKNIKL